VRGGPTEKLQTKNKKLKKMLITVRETLRWNISVYARKDEQMMFRDLEAIDKLLKEFK
jgi:hypothetical protein